MRKRFLAGAAVGAFFLWLALRNVSFPEVAAALRRVSLPLFGAFVLMHLSTLWVRAARWAMLLRPVAEVPSGRLVPPLAVGYMVNFLLPARAGELVRCWMLQRRDAVSPGTALGTVVVERLLDGLAVFLLLALAPFLIGSGDAAILARIKWAALGVLAAYVAMLVALYALGHHREVLGAFLARHPLVQRSRLLGRVVRLVVQFAEGLGVLRSGRDLAAAALVSIGLWAWAGLANLLAMHAIGLDLPGYAPFFLVVMQAFGVLVPSPGFVGPYQYAHVVALAVYGVSEAMALSLALLIHTGLFVAVLAPGFWFAAREHIGLRDIERASREEAAAD